MADQCFFCISNMQVDFDALDDIVLEMMVTPLLDHYYRVSSSANDLPARCRSFVAISCPDKECGRPTCVFCSIAYDVGESVARILETRGEELRWYRVDHMVTASVEALCLDHKRVGVALVALHQKRSIARRRNA